MGDKTAARALAEQCGVPTVPGTKMALEDPSDALEFARSAGFPVILKAAMGGGGRGMRVVRKGVLLLLFEIDVTRVLACSRLSSAYKARCWGCGVAGRLHAACSG